MGNFSANYPAGFYRQESVATVMFLEISPCASIAGSYTKMNPAVIDEYIKMTCTRNAIKPSKPAATHECTYLRLQCGLKTLIVRLDFKIVR